MAERKKILISGGGTGGHIYPAIAIANQLKINYPNADFLFVGAKGKMEMEKVPQAGYKIKGLWIAGLQRKLTLQNILFPVKLMVSLIKAKRIVAKFKPDVVIGTGGFASGPILQMATQKNIPSLVQEQNSYAGVTNKILSKKADKICVAYQNMERYFPSDKIVFTGNPVRQDLLEVENKKEEALKYFGLESDKKILLVLGGSLGARAINKMIAENLDYLVAKNIQVIWQTGKFYIEEYKHYQERKGVQLHAYISQMDLAYAASDFIVSRAGASSVSELCIVGKPVVFVPSPNVAEDHQTKNANAIVSKNAAILLKESDVNNFTDKIDVLLNNKDLTDQLSQNIKQLAKPNATVDIVNEIKKITQWS